MSDASSPASAERVQQFLQWFSALEADEQEVLMALVQREKTVRDVVKSLGAMGLDQRREVFERLGLPSELVARIPGPDPGALAETDVEWVDWKAPGS